MISIFHQNCRQNGGKQCHDARIFGNSSLAFFLLGRTVYNYTMYNYTISDFEKAITYCSLILRMIKYAIFHFLDFISKKILQSLSN